MTQPLLDLFAGTGSVGIEALSRGARFVRFVDKNPASNSNRESKPAHTGLAQFAQVNRMDAFQFVKISLIVNSIMFTLHHPSTKSYGKTLSLPWTGMPDWLSEDAWVIVQIHPSRV
jgi:16S rRNA (guanine966-N2)-methyltransferase